MGGSWPVEVDRADHGHQSAFAGCYAATGERAEKLAAGGPILDQANNVPGYLKQLYQDSIGEACFIDDTGAEIARVVRGKRARLADLPRVRWPYHEHMATPSRDTDEREHLTYPTANPEQVAAARVNAQRKLADSEANHTPEYWADLRERLGLPARAA